MDCSLTSGGSGAWAIFVPMIASGESTRSLARAALKSRVGAITTDAEHQIRGRVEQGAMMGTQRGEQLAQFSLFHLEPKMSRLELRL